MPQFAVGIASGVRAGRSGMVYQPSIKAAATLTLALPKTGLGASGVREQLGDLYLADLSVPPAPYCRPGLEGATVPPRTSWRSFSGRMAAG